MKCKCIKKLISLFLFVCLIGSSITVISADTAGINIIVNNKIVVMDQEPVLENGRTLVPLRAVFEALGADVLWDENTQTITGTRQDTQVVLTVGDTQAYVNGNAFLIDEPAKIMNGRTLVPVRFIAESFHCNVAWQEKTKTVIITDGNNILRRDLSVHFIDVGQADSILIMLPNDQNMLIDAGNNEDGDSVVNYIKSEGISTLDYVVGTHPHEDHIGGMDDIINTFNIGGIYMPKVSSTTQTFEDVITAIQNKGLQVNRAQAGINLLNSNGLSIDILAPAGDTYDDLNNYSAVVKLTYLNNSFLFMSDAQELAENQITADVKADVLKVGHHGSDTSTSEAFLTRVSPKYAVISVGAGNTYGHPTQSVLNLLNNYGAYVYRTDEAGTVTITSDGNNLTIDKNASVIESNAPPENVAPQPTLQPEQQEDSSSQIVYVTKTGTKYHRDGCSSLSKSKIPIPLSEARLKYQPCSKCNPPT